MFDRVLNAPPVRNFFASLITLKVRPSPSKEICFICFNESPSKVMKNAFYFILKALFVLKISKFLSGLFGHVEKTT